jgi:hypothetical protein
MSSRLGLWFAVAVTVIACGLTAPSIGPSAPTSLPTVQKSSTPAPTRAAAATPRFDPDATDRIGVVVRGTLGTAICLVLKPSEDSPEMPSGGMGQFEVRLPDSYDFVPNDPKDTSWNRTFRILDSSGAVVAESGEKVEILADIPRSWGSICMVGQPLTALVIRRVS